MPYGLCNSSRTDWVVSGGSSDVRIRDAGKSSTERPDTFSQCGLLDSQYERGRRVDAVMWIAQPKAVRWVELNNHVMEEKKTIR
jgi:hypothetical protein